MDGFLGSGFFDCLVQLAEKNRTNDTYRSGFLHLHPDLAP
jgi:hypothetical protein